MCQLAAGAMFAMHRRMVLRFREQGVSRDRRRAWVRLKKLGWVW